MMSFRVMTVNVNGIRSAERKGFFTWLKHQEADVVCIQEVRAHKEQLDSTVYYPEGYHCYYVDAHKKGYSGVAIYSRRKPNKVVEKIGFSLADMEARYIHAEFDDVTVVSLYLPSGTSGDERQAEKYAFMDWYLPFIKEQAKTHKQLIICGDWNIVHKQIDIKNWASNQKSSGCLPEERAWLDKVFEEFVDAFRVLNHEPEQYTWWSNRARAWENNVGWRIDYQVITPSLKHAVKKVEIYRQEKFSDHAPLIIDYQF